MAEDQEKKKDEVVRLLSDVESQAERGEALGQDIARSARLARDVVGPVRDIIRIVATLESGATGAGASYRSPDHHFPAWTLQTPAPLWLARAPRDVTSARPVGCRLRRMNHTTEPAWPGCTSGVTSRRSPDGSAGLVDHPQGRKTKGRR
jgi:hypothetical protein